MSSRDSEPTPSKKSRRRIDLEPISMEEILGAPGMSGFVSILDPREQVPHLQALVDNVRETEPQKAAPPASGSNVIDFQRSTEPAGAEPALPVQKGPGPVRAPGAERDTRHALPQPPGRAHLINGHYVRRAVLAQDGHSSGEEVLYQALWNCRYARQETKESRLITIGWKAMSKIARLTPRNTKRNCQNLILKLAIEQLSDENSRESIGRTYRLFSYKAILERRRAAGMEWITRSRGVSFVDAPPAVIPRVVQTAPDAGSASGTQSVPVIKRDTGSAKGTGGERDPGSLRSGHALIVRAVREYVADVDDASIDSLMEACRRAAPDATEEEVVHFVRLKADLMCRMGTVKSPMGFLKTAVPRCFEGESFRQFRAAEAQRRERAAEEEVRREEEARRFKEEQEGILKNPHASAEERRFARVYLGLE